MSNNEVDKLYEVVARMWLVGSLFTAIGCIIVLSMCNISIFIRILVSIILAVTVIPLLIFMYAIILEYKKAY